MFLTQSILPTTLNPDQQRFLDKVQDYQDPNACWTWTGAKHGQGRGYGKFWFGGRSVPAHRASHLLFNGPIDDGMVVNHGCVCESCVNPAHLWQCTQSDNVLYSVAVGTHNSCQKRDR